MNNVCYYFFKVVMLLFSYALGTTIALIVMAINSSSVSAYSVPQKEEFILIETEDARVCEDFAEFTQYMKDNYGINVNLRLASYNFNSVKTAAAGIEYVIKQYPMLKGKIKEFNVGYNYRNPYALGTYFDGEILFYNGFFTKTDEYIENWLSKAENNEKYFHSKNNENVFSYGMHEAAHLLTTLILEDEGETDYDSYYLNKKKAIKIINDVIGISDHYVKKTKMAEISQYAATNEMECIAEAICDYLVNKEDAAEFSKQIAEYFKKYEKEETPEFPDVSFY